ncbi:MAG TPA: 5-(carboxyamino)imidazole ribonucleotide mutase [Chloroflexota bacterium]|nr:5-(carboxyamino)imidazole ribonucleotide mutase [Chloroflexota bacterium]
MALVTLLIGSKSDSDAVRPILSTLERFGVSCTAIVCSAHRAPERLHRVIKEAEASGTLVFICGAGLAAALPGATASHTTKPVIGLPLASGALNGVDSLYSIVQMPPGVPVAGVGINGAANAAYLAVQLIALTDPALAERYATFRKEQSDRVDTFE